MFLLGFTVWSLSLPQHVRFILGALSHDHHGKAIIDSIFLVSLPMHMRAMHAGRLLNLDPEP